MRYRVRWIGTPARPDDRTGVDPVIGRLRAGLASLPVQYPVVERDGRDRVAIGFDMTCGAHQPAAARATEVVGAALAAAGLGPDEIETRHLTHWVLGPSWLVARRGSGRWVGWAVRDPRSAGAATP